MTNAEYATYFAPNLSMFRNFAITIEESIVDETAKKVVMLARSTADTNIGRYGNQYVIAVEMSQDGARAERVVEFVDSG